jgi:NAD(P)-dependent dehydrogenase (short-subunit alcohol dehydrogenase family)
MQVVLITGGSTGIGRATGELLQSNGYTVVGTSRSPDRYTDHPFPLIQMDLHDARSIQRAVETVVSQYGTIDVLVNNAGKGIAGPIEETPLEEIRSVFETNLVGATAVLQSVLPVMRTQNKGKIINITSIAAYAGLPFRAAYSATKSALHMLTESLRLELKPSNIQCCTLAPGDVATNIAQGRYHVPVKENSPYLAIYWSCQKRYGYTCGRWGFCKNGCDFYQSSCSKKQTQTPLYCRAIFTAFFCIFKILFTCKNL